ncbi:MAG: hypothetical protein PHW25_08055 [Zoogloea sp.]|uniref:hypothetical protein n=1 Tax=Zoogloea sp. TaxID=49181 RepID=UPI00262D07F7|nr:hypothetical protein [Zoogloea sp.]MDD3327022.1 hypothetical protein [Zoogloea sp.]
MKYFRMSRRFPARGVGVFHDGKGGSLVPGFRMSPAPPAQGSRGVLPRGAGRRALPEPAGLFQDSHHFFLLKTGHRLEEGFVPPFKVVLDPEIANPQLPTFFESPAWIGTQAFYRDLLAAGIDNIEAVPVEMRDDARKRIIHDYLLLNIVGCVACADMEKSTVSSLGEGIDVITRLVVDASRLGAFDLCVAAEDTDCMIVSERIARHLQACGYDDILLEELEQA